MEIHFIFGKHEYDDAVRNLDLQDDRGAVLVVSSILEETLRDAITRQFINRDKKIESLLMKGYGPLASFRSKIDIGFLLGLYSIQAHENFQRVREIRNRMAHKITNQSFSHQEIKDQCQHLPSQANVVEGWMHIKNIIIEMSTLAGVEPDLAAIDTSISALTFDKRKGDRGKFMTYVQNRISSLRMIVSDGLTPAARLAVSRHL